MATITINYDIKKVTQVDDLRVAVTYVLHEDTTNLSQQFIEYLNANALNQGVLDNMTSPQVVDKVDANFLTLIAANMSYFTLRVQSKLSYISLSNNLPTLTVHPLMGVSRKIDIQK